MFEESLDEGSCAVWIEGESWTRRSKLCKWIKVDIVLCAYGFVGTLVSDLNMRYWCFCRLETMGLNPSCIL